MSSVNEWNESLFGCFDDWGTCCYGYWCLPCLFGSNAKKINDQNCCLMCCAYTVLSNCYLCWVPHLIERKALRERYNINEDPSCGDILATVCCSPCAICQETRELKSREGTGAVYRPNNPTVISQPQPTSGDVYRV